MSKRLTAILTALVSLGLAPAIALAQAACGDLPLTMEQETYLSDQGVEIVIPDGELPIIQRCDVDGNLSVDINDIRAIILLRNTPAAHNQDPADWDRNGQVNISDARGCQRTCANARCAVSQQEPTEPEGGIVDQAECFQTEDFDGDGSEDIVAIAEQSEGPPRGGDWTLEVVILNEDASGNVQHVRYPYTGKKSATDEIQQHLGAQPAGVVNLNPGTVTLTEPGIVSYQDGEPTVLYYFVNGEVARAFYGIDD